MKIQVNKEISLEVNLDQKVNINRLEVKVRKNLKK